MEQTSMLEEKRISIRREHRKQELDSFFAHKRRIMLQVYHQNSRHSFQYLFEKLQEGKQLTSHLEEMANLLGQDEPFVDFDGRGERASFEMIQESVIKLTELVIVIIQYLKSEHESDLKGREACLTILLNIAVDKEVQIEGVCHLMCQFLSQFYSSLQIWGYDKETELVGWLIGNIIEKSLARCDVSNLLYIMEWICQFMAEKNASPSVIRRILENLPVFFNSLRDFYNTGNYCYPELFKSNCINLIADTIERYCDSQTEPSVLQKSLLFLNSQVGSIYLYFPTSHYTQKLIDRLVTMLGVLKYSICRNAINLLSSMVDFKGSFSHPNHAKILKRMEGTRKELVEKHGTKLINFLLMRELNIKIGVLSLIRRALDAEGNNSQYLIQTMAYNDLERVMAELFEWGDQELNLDCQHLAAIMTDRSRGRFGRKYFETIEQISRRNIGGMDHWEEDSPL